MLTFFIFGGCLKASPVTSTSTHSVREEASLSSDLTTDFIAIQDNQGNTVAHFGLYSSNSPHFKPLLLCSQMDFCDFSRYQLEIWKDDQQIGQGQGSDHIPEILKNISDDAHFSHIYLSKNFLGFLNPFDGSHPFTPEKMAGITFVLIDKKQNLQYSKNFSDIVLKRSDINTAQ